jgi:hypothetical protein
LRSMQLPEGRYTKYTCSHATGVIERCRGNDARSESSIPFGEWYTLHGNRYTVQYSQEHDSSALHIAVDSRAAEILGKHTRSQLYFPFLGFTRSSLHAAQGMVGQVL